MTSNEIPEHLEITRELAGKVLEDGKLHANAVISAIGQLEGLIRNPPGDHPMIDAGPLEATPIAHAYIAALETATPRYVTRADAGPVTAGATFMAVKALELGLQALARRIG